MKSLANNRWVSLLTVVAFLMNVMLPFFAVYNVPQAIMAAQSGQPYSERMASFFGEKILICTSGGFKWVSWEDLQNGEEQPEPHPKYECALCYVTASGLKDFIPATNAAITYGDITRYISYDTPHDVIFRKHSSCGSQPRAPPDIA